MLPDNVIQGNKRLGNILQPFNSLLSTVISEGAPLSKDVLYWKASSWVNRLRRLKNELTELTGVRINIGSSDQRNALLYGKIKKSKSEDTESNLANIEKHSLYLPPVINEEGKVTSDSAAMAELHYEYGRCKPCKGTGKVIEGDKATGESCFTCQGSGKTDYERVIAVIREIRLLTHRADNFLWPFFDYTECNKCSTTAKSDLRVSLYNM